jgi:hypothetical protein
MPKHAARSKAKNGVKEKSNLSKAKHSRALPLALKKRHTASLLRGMHTVLKEQGLSGKITHMQMNVAASAGQCPPGQVWRMVCEPDEKGTTRCEFKCVPE